MLVDADLALAQVLWPEPVQFARGTSVLHWPMWLPLVMSWKGSQNAGKLGSIAAAARAGSKATIHSWVVWFDGEAQAVRARRSRR